MKTYNPMAMGPLPVRLFLVVWALGLAWLSRGITIDYWDGVLSVVNGLLLWGRAPEGAELHPGRSLLGSVLLSPFAAAGHALGGPLGALSAARLAMTASCAVALACAHRLWSRLLPAPAAAALLALAAADALLVQYAPFALFDAFGGAAVVLFTAATAAYARAPGRRSLALVAAAFALALLARLHLAVLLPVPSAAALLVSAAPWRRRLLEAAAPALLLPAAGYAAAVLGGALLLWATSSDGPASAAARCHRLLVDNAAFNWGGQAGRGPLLYLESLWTRLGPAGCALALAGAALLLRGGPLEKTAALALLLPLLALQWGLANQERRYALCYLPLLYAAVGRGALEAWRRSPAPARAVLAVLCLALWPWAGTAEALSFLGREPGMRSDAHLRLAESVARAVPEGGCFRWEGEDHSWASTPRRLAPEQQPALGAPVLAFFSGRSSSCLSPAATVVWRDGLLALEDGR